VTVAAVVCTASRERTALLRACVDSILAGLRRPDEIFVVVDRNPPLRAELAASLPAPVRVLACERGGLSEARNAGVRAARCDVVAFVDDDATVDREWLVELLQVLERVEHVVGVGGPVTPRWGADPRWLPEELLWVVGCTYRGHPEEAGPIRNPIGCNMAFRRRELVALGGFARDFGKQGNALETCDETELSLRLERALGPGRIRYAPAARVHHFVPPARISWRLVLRRSLSEGLSKGRLHRAYSGSALGPERGYVRRLLTESIPRLLARGLARRDPNSVLGAAALALSLSVTGAAFLVGATTTRRARAQGGAGR
jgi:glycosyltransferase involved in cell wall biosynthesis